MRSLHRNGFLLFSAVAGVVATWSGAARAITFPADSAWVPLTRAGVPLADPLGDGVNERDIVGDATNPAAYVTQDATHLYFRLRVDKDPKMGTTWRPFGWGCGIDANNTANTLEFWAVVNGIENMGPDGNPDAVEYRWNQTPTPDAINDPIEVLVATFAATEPAGYSRKVNAASMFGGDPDYFIDWAIPLATIRTPPAASGAPGIAAGVPLRFACGSSANAQRMDSDPVAPAGATTLTGIISDPMVCGPTGCFVDRDGDGVPDATEILLGTDPTKTDSDGDGIPDNVELSATGSTGPFAKIDTDGDGTIDALDTESDGDGILDSVEGATDPDGDGLGNYRDLDSDNDCVSDATEVAAERLDATKPSASPSSNCSGATPVCDTTKGVCVAALPDAGVDAADTGVADTTVADTSVADTTVGDTGGADTTIADATVEDTSVADTSVADTGADTSVADTGADTNADTSTPDDRDGDGVLNGVEISLGTDPDKADSDGDGIPDGVELSESPSGGAPFTRVDTDGDGTIDALDPDSDGDGIPDSVEGTGDPDGDGKPNFRDLDSDGDGKADKDETANDLDKDGVGNYLDLDSDNDCLSDATETADGFLDPTKPSASPNNNCSGATPICDTNKGVCVSLVPDGGVDVDGGAISADGSVEGGAGSCAFGGGSSGSALVVAAAAALVAAGVARRRRRV